ncbi:MAG: Fur family transcriptional regulator [Dongiaceae bacterium]
MGERRRPGAPERRHGAPRHDHQDCIAEALSRADAVCRARSANLTEIRRRVLELVWSGHAPIGAYEILDALRRDGISAQPPTVYRALEFLLAQGLVHRIESRNAFIGCAQPDERHSSQFLICRDCGTVQELSDRRIGAAVSAGARDVGFEVGRSTVEVEGRCMDCSTHAG